MIAAAAAAMPAAWLTEIAEEAVKAALRNAESIAPALAREALAAAITERVHLMLSDPNAQRMIDNSARSAVNAILAKIQP